MTRDSSMQSGALVGWLAGLAGAGDDRTSSRREGSVDRAVAARAVWRNVDLALGGAGLPMLHVLAID